MQLSGAGLELLRASERLLDRGFRTFASAGQPAPHVQGSDDVEHGSRDLVSATIDVIVGRFLFSTGVALIETEQETSSSLVDILA